MENYSVSTRSRRNQLIGTALGRAAGYAVQGFFYCQVATVFNPQTAVLIKAGTKYGGKLLKYTSKHSLRTDFSNESIFSDAIDASFLAY